MHRFHLPPEQCQAGEILLAGREAHHGLRVLRLGRGDRVMVFDGIGHEYECEVIESKQPSIRLQVKQETFHPQAPCRLTLWQAIPKGKLMDAIVQKATELGVSRIVPLVSERVIMRLDSESAAQKVAHWRLITIEAAKQCGSPWLPQIDSPITPADFLLRHEQFDLSLIASLHPGHQHPRGCLTAFRDQHGPACATGGVDVDVDVGVWIGPEGDFSAAEVDAVVAAGAKPITLGRQVLRVETAAVYCLSILKYELQTPAEASLLPPPGRSA